MDAVQLCFRMRKEDSTPFSSKLLTHLDINKAPKKKKIQTVNVNVLERELEPGWSIFTHCRWKQRDLKQQDGGGKKREGGPAADAVLATEEKRWSRRRRDALS